MFYFSSEPIKELFFKLLPYAILAGVQSHVSKEVLFISSEYSVNGRHYTSISQ